MNPNLIRRIKSNIVPSIFSLFSLLQFLLLLKFPFELFFSGEDRRFVFNHLASFETLGRLYRFACVNWTFFFVLFIAWTNQVLSKSTKQEPRKELIRNKTKKKLRTHYIYVYPFFHQWELWYCCKHKIIQIITLTESNAWSPHIYKILHWWFFNFFSDIINYYRILNIKAPQINYLKVTCLS